MNEISPPARGLALAAQESALLSACAPALLRGGPVDLMARLPDGGLRFIATLEAGTLLLPGPPGTEWLLRARRRLLLQPAREEDEAGLRPWLQALHQAAATLGTVLDAASLHPQAQGRSDQLLTAIAAALAAPAPEAERREDAAYQATLAGFPRLLQRRFRRAPKSAGGPLAEAAAELARQMGARPVAVPEDPEEGREDFLERFAAAHGLRLRALRLDNGARPEGEGPMLVFAAGDTPLLLLPRRFGGYDMFSLAAGGARRRLRQADWSALAAEAYGFCRTLPAGKLSFRSLLGFGLQAATADFVLLGACGVVGAGLALLPPLASQQITNIAVHTADTRFLFQLLAALLAALLVETAFFAIGQLAELRAQGRAGLALHAAMVDRLLRLSPNDLRGSTTLILATEMETVEKFRRALIGFGSTGLLALIHGLAAAALVATISPAAGLLAIGAILLRLGLTALIGWLQFRAIYEGERMDVIVLAFVYDLVRMVPALRGNRLERRAFTQWGDNFLAFQARLMRSASIGDRLPVLEHLWDALVLAACFAALAFANAQAEVNAGQAVAFVLVLGRLTRAGKGLSHALMGAMKLLPMAKLARPLLDFSVEPLVSGPPVPVLSGRIDVVDVSFFFGARRALDRISFSIADGEFVAITGASGSGKSTLLSLLAGLQPPQAGRLLLDGHDLSGINRRQLTRKLGLVMQNSRLFPGSVYDNIRGTTAIDMDAAWGFAAQAGVAEELRAMPMGLHTLVGETGMGFSLSQVQRILIARALAQSPSVLILDEAMSALDGAAQRQVMRTLRGLPVTRIIVAHRPALWRETDRIIMLRDGALAAAGPPAAMLATPSTFQPPTLQSPAAHP
ncbi:ATP-binding cassette domain-containing protein [Roseomonas aerophila]|uniref:ATP-binding cassette domain-containing protein n=1 Tax=Teichococcus aerophilus TaxID=1224513 RepID=A0ABR7RP04_9PROT|nr:ATP-binding cassette domain-containing protein [Pseudoroseomonas aerophila]MBC9208304.1 ATP-binding cassette domain-containing protein [Pseudoroseomonas aerophila]